MRKRPTTATRFFVQVTYRLTYDDVEDMLANGIAESSDEWELGRLDELATLRHRCAYQQRVYNS